MNGLYNIACVLLCMVPMLSFIAAAVVFVMHGHPYFGGASMVFAIFTQPKVSLGNTNGKENKEKDK